MKLLEVFVVVMAAFLAGCAKSEVVEEAPPRARVREGVTATAVVSEGHDHAERMLAPALARSVGAVDLGRVASARAARTDARAVAADLVLVCHVKGYDPYDPQKLILSLELVDVASGRMGAEDAMALGWRGSIPPEALAREETLWTADAEIDAGSETMLRDYATTELNLYGMRKDIAEASILLRDPARFFPFAARLIASRVPVDPLRPLTAPALAYRR